MASTSTTIVFRDHLDRWYAAVDPKLDGARRRARYALKRELLRLEKLAGTGDRLHVVPTTAHQNAYPTYAIYVAVLRDEAVAPLNEDRPILAS